MTTDGFDDAADDLEELAENAQELDGENDIPVDELFSNGFMQKYTDFASIDEFFEASPWVVESDGDLEAVPEDELDGYVNDHTRFPGWEEMIGKVGEIWTANQLGL